MFQKFFTDTIESKFIKALLRKTPLPIYPSVSDNDYVINGYTYINKYGVVRFTETGIAKDCDFIRLFPYILNINEKSFTENFVSKYNYYDTETHEKFGDYLRIYRDLNKIDLMPFYNCFSYRFFDDVYLTKKKSCGYSIGKNNLYKIVAIPIKFDKTYTIALDSASSIFIKSFLHDSLGPLSKDLGQGNIEYITELLKNCKVIIDDYATTNDGCKVFSQTSFSHPIHYKISIAALDDLDDFSDEEKRRLKSLEKYLYLLIQIPTNNTSSIVVLEGDYTNNKINDFYFSLEELHEPYSISYEELDELYGYLNDPESEYYNPDLYEKYKDFYDYYRDYNGTRYDFLTDYIINYTGLDYIKSNISESNQSVSFDFIINLINETTDDKKNLFMLSDLSLLEMKTSSIYAFNNRVVEYLLLNVIDSSETIDNNVTKVQDVLQLTNRLDIFPSIWSDIMRYSLYKKYLESKLFKTSNLDINGFVDKDVEKLLIKEDGDF